MDLEWWAKVVAVAVPLAGVIQWMMQRWSQWKKDQFDAYHRLVKELVQGDGTSEPISLDRQMAVVFELRHFPRYYSVSERILARFNGQIGDQYPALKAEIELTLAYIDRNRPLMLDP
jgi:hypothetical protein